MPNWLAALWAMLSGGNTVTPEVLKARIATTCGIIVPLADTAALITANPGVVTAAGLARLVCGAFSVKKAASPKEQGGTLEVGKVRVHYVIP